MTRRIIRKSIRTTLESLTKTKGDRLVDAIYQMSVLTKEQARQEANTVRKLERQLGKLAELTSEIFNLKLRVYGLTRNHETSKTQASALKKNIKAKERRLGLLTVQIIKTAAPLFD